MFFENDRTYCGNAECKHTECYRHQANIVGKPRFISIADFEGTKECMKESEMSREKQIEEMAKILAKSDDCGDCTNCMHNSWCPDKNDAELIYNAGYRKASEVAREIFEEIEKILDQKFSINHGVVLISKEEFAELKKKYIQSEDK